MVPPPDSSRTPPADALASRKQALRHEVFARRKAAHAAAGACARDAGGRLLDCFADAPLPAVVAGYRPIRTEIDPTPALAALIDRGAGVVLPVVAGPGLALRFRVWTPGVAMTVGAFGAEIPAGGDWLEPLLLIVPLVAFDRAGWRLGYGGGFYDRTLAELRARRPTRAVGFAYAAQEVAEVPRHPADQRLDAIVTEREVVRPA